MLSRYETHSSHVCTDVLVARNLGVRTVSSPKEKTAIQAELHIGRLGASVLAIVMCRTTSDAGINNSAIVTE